MTAAADDSINTAAAYAKEMLRSILVEDGRATNELVAFGDQWVDWVLYGQIKPKDRPDQYVRTVVWKSVVHGLWCSGVERVAADIRARSLPFRF